MLACGLRAASSAGQPLARGASRNALAHALPGRAAQGGRADPKGGHQREQGGMGWADAVGGKGRLIFLYSQAGRPTIAVQSDLDMFVTLFAAAFAGLALPVEQVGTILLAFSQLPEADMRQALDQLGQRPELWHSLYWTPWLDARGQQVLLSALYMCEWAYVAEYQGQQWFFMSDIARLMLGLEEVPTVPPLTTDFKVLPNFCVLAAIDLPLETLVPLFRYGKIQRIDRVVEFQLDKQHLADMPSKTSGQHELRAVLQSLEPLPATIDRLLNNQRIITGTVSIRGCSAIVKPENAEVLATIKAHRRLKGYLDTEAPAGYLLIKPRSNPHEFIRRCQELGFTVTSL